MTILRSGPNKKYASNWASAFGKKKATKKAAKKSKPAKKGAFDRAKSQIKKTFLPLVTVRFKFGVGKRGGHCVPFPAGNPQRAAQLHGYLDFGPR